MDRRGDGAQALSGRPADHRHASARPSRSGSSNGKVLVIAADGTRARPRRSSRALRRPSVRGRRRAPPRGHATSSRCSTRIRRSATRCAPSILVARPPLEPASSRTASTCACRRPTSSDALTTLARLDREKKPADARHRRRSICGCRTGSRAAVRGGRAGARGGAQEARSQEERGRHMSDLGSRSDTAS